MLMLVAFLAICIVAALFPTLTAYVIFGAVVVLVFPQVRDRWSNRK